MQTRWPNPTDYQDAVQNPHTCFQDPELKAGTVALLPMGLPRVASGNFASVYEIQTGKKRWAVRCFLRQAAHQQRHYEHVSRHLKDLWLPFLVDFEYQPQGIRLLGQTYPLVKMQWVDGVALHSFVKKHLKHPQNLLKLAAQWRGIANSLCGSRLAHGDLQHGNVLVTSKGYIRLVDYDAMYVPSLHGTNCAELGHANYQHPQRQGTNHDYQIDNFSALVIYASLRALAADPGLWDAFHTGENLIFSASDFKNPMQSEVFQRVKRLPAPEVHALAHELEKWCCGPFAQIGNFESVVSAPRPIAVQQAVTPQALVPPSVSQPAPTPAPSSAPPNRWWMSANVTQTESLPSPPAKPQMQTAPIQAKPSAVPFAAPRQPVIAPPPMPAPGQIKINPVDGAEMVWIPEGDFTMGFRNGYNDEKPQREVWLDGFWMYKYAVTVAQYERYCIETGRPMPKSPVWGLQHKYPIVNVSWADAVLYCRWAGVYLPTEAQWEKAARGTTGRIYPWGDIWDAAKCCSMMDAKTKNRSPVNVDAYTAGASPYGIVNMIGNVSEWCSDWYSSAYYQIAPSRNPHGPSSGTVQAVRGISWKGNNLQCHRAFTRFSRSGNSSDDWIGFRCVGR